MSRDKFALALGTGILAMAIVGIAMASAGQQAPPLLDSQVRESLLPDRSLISLDIPSPDAGSPETLHHQVLVPADAGEVSCRLISGEGRLALRDLGIIRGRRLYSLRIDDAAPGAMEIEVRHQGDWDTASRTASRAFDELLGAPATPGERGAGSGMGSYVIIAAPDYLDAAEALAEWKQRKGFPVVTVSTDETGGTNNAILDWLQTAYDTWELPPEYVLLLGDVNTIPAWSFSGNVTDHPYTLLEGEDWLPDLFLGRLSVETVYQAETAINKSVAYEKDPYFDEGEDWFTKSLMVAGNYGSSSPTTTVTWCGEQLESLGFEPATHVFFPPTWSQPHIIDAAIEDGVSMVAYRGWAYGVKGWQPPEFTTDHIPSVENGAKTPVVMSFVCLNGDFNADEPCFGESWIRQGSPTERKGGVAFIGNGEHWSHTIYNDAMAISYFERIVDPEITTLGELTMAGRLRFMDYFPHELDETGDEMSVEFYFHIYNLLGDPELNFYKRAPGTLDVTHDLVWNTGMSHQAVFVTGDEGVMEGARVAMVQDGELLDCAFTDGDGVAILSLSRPLTDGGMASLTVTAPGYRPYMEDQVIGDAADAYLVAMDVNPATAMPGATVTFDLELENRGTAASTAFTAQLLNLHPLVTVLDDQADFDAMDPGESDICAGSFQIELDPSMQDGELIPLRVLTNLGLTPFSMTVCEPALRVEGSSASADAEPGALLDLTLSLVSEGSCGSDGVTGQLEILGDGATLVEGLSDFGAVDAGGVADNASDPFQLEIGADTAPGKSLQLRLTLTGIEGFVTVTDFALMVGDGDMGQPVGPDHYGYYAYDSADIDFPGEMPLYDWDVLSPRYGGTGTELEFDPEGNPLALGNSVLVDLPFTFTYYGQDFDQLLVSDNGWASFDPSNTLDFYNWPLPNPHGNHSVIAPMWDNFAVALGDSVVDADYRDGAYWAAENGVFTVEWSQMRHYLPSVEAFQTFQLKLYDPDLYPTASGDGEILFLYKQVANVDSERNYATVGIEAPDEIDGILYTYALEYADGAAPLSPGLAVKFTTDPPAYEPMTLSRGRVLREGEGWRLQWAPSDDRPLLGWRVWRGEELLTTSPLPASAREYVAGGGEGEFRLTALHPFGQETELGTLTTLEALSLLPASPNPSTGGTWIGFAMDREGPAQLRIYDPAGRLVRELFSGTALSGEQSRFWDGRDEGGRAVASGVYFYRLEAGGRSLTRKLVLVR